MRRVIFALALFMLFLAGCGDGSSRTDSATSVRDGESRDVKLTLMVDEHRDIALPIEPESSYSVSSRTLQEAGSAQGALSCSEAIASNVVDPAGYTNVNYGIIEAASDARSTLRLVGTYPGEEVICLQVRDRDTGALGEMRVSVTVLAPDGWGSDDLIDGAPIDPDDPGDPGGPGDPGDPSGPGGPPPPPIDQGPGEQPEYDERACVTAGFYRVSDDWQSTEGQFGPDQMAYIRSRMPGLVDSEVSLFYPALNNVPADPQYTNLGRYQFVTHEAVTISFELQMAHVLFGLADRRHFYIRSNDYCLRGNIPGSAMTPPDKSLTWVSSVPQN